eukprot:gnl/Spiro4/11534_TR6093_c0_g1_i1.p2 gnl/Spiro4/11534_TR6093_c0_g1~~gnl/Spiro4/11534_TR6093_c0_g1_i1.p2  ORF type:complete len:124 (+),score=24.10 gnl/Spiro4/11534_TR6093_c0_g1_i1:133-504(+)
MEADTCIERRIVRADRDGRVPKSVPDAVMTVEKPAWYWRDAHDVAHTFASDAAALLEVQFEQALAAFQEGRSDTAVAPLTTVEAGAGAQSLLYRADVSKMTMSRVGGSSRDVLYLQRGCCQLR